MKISEATVLLHATNKSNTNFAGSSFPSPTLAPVPFRDIFNNHLGSVQSQAGHAPVPPILQEFQFLQARAGSLQFLPDTLPSALAASINQQGQWLSPSQERLSMDIFGPTQSTILFSAQLQGVYLDMSLILEDLMTGEYRFSFPESFALPEVVIPLATGTKTPWPEANFSRPPQVGLARWGLLHEEQEICFQASGEVLCEDGRTINFDIDQLTTEEQTVALFSSTRSAPVFIDPLVLDLNGQGVEFSSNNFDFDLDCDGTAQSFSSLQQGSGFLAYDINGDGLINDGSELFGASSGNGFLELAEYDLDGNSWIDENDVIFSDLSIWSWDDDGEVYMASLLDSDVGAIGLDNVATGLQRHDDSAQVQGQMRSAGIFLHESGGVQAIHQIDLAVRERNSSLE